MKIAIITLHRVINYGSVLQAYSTQKIIEDLGHEVEIIDYIPEQCTSKVMYFSVPNFRKKDFIHKYSYLLFKPFSIFLRKFSFDIFIHKHIKLTKRKYILVQALINDPPTADIYISGSDQVWNCYYNQGVDKGFFLDFVPDEYSKIAFASSFGQEKLSDNEYNEIKPMIHKYKAISVREDTALNVLEALDYHTGICIIDPTLQTSKENWLNLASKRLVKEKYLILMLLYNEDNGATEWAQQIAAEKGLLVVKLSWDIKKPHGIDVLKTHRSPEDFLSLFYYAEYVVTNSFHGLAFSINFNKQFIMAPRNQFNNRIESLLRLVGLENRIMDKELNWSVVNEYIKYEPINKIIAKERAKAVDFLKQAGL